MSYDPSQVATVWRPVQYMARRAYHGPMVEVHTSDSRRLRVTDEHPMMIFEHEEFRTRPAAALQPGDELIVPTGPVPARSPDPIDVMARLPGA